MAVPRIDFYTIYKRAVAAIVAAPAGTFSAVLDDPRRSAGEIFASLQAADDEVCTLRAEAEGGSNRTLFLSDTSDLSHGDTLPDRLGSLTQVKIRYVSTDVEYKAGKFDKDLTLADIERWRANVGSIYGAAHDAANSSLSGFYMELGDEIFFTGYRAKAKYASFTRNSRDVTDGAMSSGSKVLTGTLVAISADVGAGVIVDGAGAAGVPLVSRVDVFTSSGSITLRDANASGGSITGKTVTIAKLQAPQTDEDAVLSIALTGLVKRGDNQPFANLWIQRAANYAARIKAGEEILPKLELAQAA